MAVNDDEVRASERPNVRASDVRASDVLDSKGEDGLDAALASLTDVSPSPTLHTKVMRRVADVQSEGHAVISRRSYTWRLAVAAAVVLLAAAVWLAVRPAPAPQIATTRPPAQDGVGSPQGGRESPGGSGVVTPPIDQPRAGLVEAGPEHAGSGRTGTTRRHRVTAAPPTRSSASASAGLAQPTSGLEDIATPPLAPPDPVHVAPLTLETITVDQIEIPPLQIDPVEGKPSTERGR